MDTSKEKTFGILWTRMTERGDFPTLARNINNIVTAMDDSDASTHDLVGVILADFSLTQKVIRLANSAMYAAFGGDVTTVTRAVAVLGVDAIGHLALGLQMLDDFVGLSMARGTAKHEMRRALVASTFARKITVGHGIREAEEAVVCTLMRHLARLLVVFYFPDEWVQIEQLARSSNISVSSACHDVLGVSLEEISEQAARRWGLPRAVAESMHPSRLAKDVPLTTHGRWLTAVAMVSGDVAEQLDEHRDNGRLGEGLAGYAEWLGIEPEQFTAALHEIADYHRTLDDDSTAKSASARSLPEDRLHEASASLARALDEVRAAADTMDVNILTPLVLETLMHSLGLERSIGFFLNHANRRFDARLGFGPDVPEKLPRLSFEEGFVPDVFHFALTQKSVVFVKDTTDRQFSHRLPAWYTRQFPDTRSFMLIPVQLRGRCIGLLYGDWGTIQCDGLQHADVATIWRLGEQIAGGFERLMSAQLGMPRHAEKSLA